MNDDHLKGILIGAGFAAVVCYLYNKNSEKVHALADGAIEKVPATLYPLKNMSTEKLTILKENIDDVMAEREALPTENKADE